MQKGVVKWFSSEKGYGFITSLDQDYFVHYTDIKIDGFKSLTNNQKVMFEPTKTTRGLTAKSVTVYVNENGNV